MPFLINSIVGRNPAVPTIALIAKSKFLNGILLEALLPVMSSILFSLHRLKRSWEESITSIATKSGECFLACSKRRLALEWQVRPTTLYELSFDIHLAQLLDNHD